MLHAVVRFLLPIFLTFFVGGCIEVKLTPDTVNLPPQPTDTISPDNTTPPPMDTTIEPSDLVLTDAAKPTTDAEPPWTTCTTHCDCENGQDCINERCVDGAQPIYCCDHSECPSEAPCWDAAGEAGICP